MPRPVAAAVFAGTVLLGGTAVVAGGNLRLPGVHTGYAPAQPIAYSHRLHAGELGIDCLYCHHGARTSRHAGVPAAEVCMNCHAQVTAGFDAVLRERTLAETEKREPRRVVSPELRELYDALGLDDELRPDPARPRPSVRWARVHDLPDFVWFDHSAHVARGLACQTCHGPVQAMERVRQEASLRMGWCVSCHRTSPANPDGAAPAVPGGRADPHVSTDCGICHD
jgi:hypothetical protein